MFTVPAAYDGLYVIVAVILSIPVWAEMSDAAKWLAVGAAIVAAVIVTGQTYPLWFFLIPMIC
jgi:drug/metabolite transporter superfamily protein YnfA